jgi:dipeptidyl aminopeptidase/acylaminoacyl peptidase
VTLTPPIRRAPAARAALAALAGLAGTAALATLAALPATSFAADAAPAAPPAPYPIKDFFSNPERGYFRLSEDGRTLSFMQPVAQPDGLRRMNIFVQSLDGSRLVGEPRKLTSETARDISTYWWKGSDTILYAKDFGGDENFHVVQVDVKTGKVTDLTPGDKLRADLVDDLPEDPGHVLIQTNQRNPEVFDIYRVDLRTGKSELVAENPGDILGWQTDHQGRVRLAVRTEGLKTTILYRADEKAAWKPLMTTDYRTEVSPAFFAADDHHFYATSNRGRDLKALVEIDPDKPDAASEQLLFTPPGVDSGDPSWSRKKKKLVRVDYEDEKASHRFFDTGSEQVWQRLQAKLPGYELILQSATLDEDKYVVAATNDRTPGARWLYDARTDTITKLGDINAKIPEAAMAEMKPITYQARDGLVIHGYLTLPTKAVLGGRDPKNLACIVNPHGGPWARDAWNYNPEVQFLANRGYCVLQMNFRGSTGYGRKFWEASFGQWGLAMQDDITDGVKWLVAQGYADPKRVGIYGGSYGGYATLAGVVYTPDVYAAAVDYVGVSNLLTFMNTIPPYWRPEMPKFHDMVGDPEKDKARLEATSPALHADRIKAPLFVAQGARDPRVNKAESDQMVAALKARGIDVEYMVKDNEGHGFHNEENQQAFYAAMERFFGTHLHPENPS